MGGCTLVAQVGEGIAELLQNRDAGVVGIEVCPQLPGHALEMPDAFLPQEGVVHGRLVEGSSGDGERFAHDVVSPDYSCVLVARPSEVRQIGSHGTMSDAGIPGVC